MNSSPDFNEIYDRCHESSKKFWILPTSLEFVLLNHEVSVLSFVHHCMSFDLLPLIITLIFSNFSSCGKPWTPAVNLKPLWQVFNLMWLTWTSCGKSTLVWLLQAPLTNFKFFLDTKLLLWISSNPHAVVFKIFHLWLLLQTYNYCGKHQTAVLNLRNTWGNPQTYMFNIKHLWYPSNSLKQKWLETDWMIHDKLTILIFKKTTHKERQEMIKKTLKSVNIDREKRDPKIK